MLIVAETLSYDYGGSNFLTTVLQWCTVPILVSYDISIHPPIPDSIILVPDVFHRTDQNIQNVVDYRMAALYFTSIRYSI